MPEPTENSSFQPERVRTYSEWRLPNYAPPVEETELRRRFEEHAATANQVFNTFLSSLGNESKEAKH